MTHLDPQSSWLSYLQWGGATPPMIVVLCLVFGLDHPTTVLLVFLDLVVILYVSSSSSSFFPSYLYLIFTSSSLLVSFVVYSFFISSIYIVLTFMQLELLGYLLRPIRNQNSHICFKFYSFHRHLWGVSGKGMTSLSSPALFSRISLLYVSTISDPTSIYTSFEVIFLIISHREFVQRNQTTQVYWEPTARSPYIFCRSSSSPGSSNLFRACSARVVLCILTTLWMLHVVLSVVCFPPSPLSPLPSPLSPLPSPLSPLPSPLSPLPSPLSPRHSLLDTLPSTLSPLPSPFSLLMLIIALVIAKMLFGLILFHYRAHLTKALGTSLNDPSLPPPPPPPQDSLTLTVTSLPYPQHSPILSPILFV